MSRNVIKLTKKVKNSSPNPTRTAPRHYLVVVGTAMKILRHFSTATTTGDGNLISCMSQRGAEETHHQAGVIRRTGETDALLRLPLLLSQVTQRESKVHPARARGMNAVGVIVERGGARLLRMQDAGWSSLQLSREGRTE